MLPLPPRQRCGCVCGNGFHSASQPEPGVWIAESTHQFNGQPRLRRAAVLLRGTKVLALLQVARRPGNQDKLALPSA